jgi:hypothetical protein
MQRRIRMDSSVKQKLNNYAFNERTDMSKIIRAKIEQYLEVGLEGIELPRVITRPATLDTELTFFVDDDLWNQGIAKAAKDGVALSDIVRASIMEDYRIALPTYKKWNGK